MKYLFYFFALIGWSCQGQAPIPDASTFSTQRIEHSLNFLTSDALKGREFGSEGIEKAGGYLINKLKAYGVAPFKKSYKDTFSFKQNTGYNVLGVIPGTDPQLKSEYVLLGAHYDHIGIRPAIKGDSIANGANDDASGTAAVLELAHYYAEHPAKRSIIIAFFSAEEKGLVGSAHLAQRFADENTPLHSVLTFEMIGVPLQTQDYTAYLTGFHKSTIAQLINATSPKPLVGFWSPAQQQHLFARSDNYPFYKALHIPAHTISTFTFVNYPHYHKVSDEVDLLNPQFMHQLLTDLLPGITAIINAKPNEVRLK